MRLIRHLILLTVLAASVLAIVVSLGHWRDRALVSELRRQMHTANDAQLPGVFERIRSIGDDGLPLVAEALGSFRPSLAFMAREHLEQHLASIELRPPAHRLSFLQNLATALATKSADYGPTASHWSADFAGQILRLAPHGEQYPRGQLLAACETLIRHAADKPSQTTLIARNEFRPDLSSPNARQPPLDDARKVKLDETWIVEQLAKYDTKPGGGLPLPSVEIPALPVVPLKPIADPARPAGENEHTPRPLEQPADAKRIDSGPGRLPLDPEAVPLRSRPKLNAPVQISAPPQVEGLPEKVPANAVTQAQEETSTIESSTLADLTQHETLAIIRSWSQAMDADRKPLAAELKLRGFTKRDFQLAEKLVDTDSEVRRQFAEALPRIRGINASPWLWWLAEDRDADVRLTAMSLLATSSDPSTRRRLATLADRENNPRVAAALRKILAPRR